MTDLDISRDRFLREVAELLGVSDEPRECGATLDLSTVVHERAVSIRLPSPGLILATDIHWPSFPVDSGISWAPKGYYARAKFEDERVYHVPAGFAPFDELYLIMGDHAEQLSFFVNRRVADLFVEHAFLRANLSGLEFFPHFVQRVHLAAEPFLHLPFPPTLYSAQFQPSHCLSHLTALLGFVARLEALVNEE